MNPSDSIDWALLLIQLVEANIVVEETCIFLVVQPENYERDPYIGVP